MWPQYHGQKHWGNRGDSWRYNVKKNKEFLPSLDFFFRARVPPNFPRKDSSFLIFADCVVPDIFQYEWCVCVLFLFPLSVNNVTLPCDAFRHQCSIQSQQQDSKQPRMQAEGGSFAWTSRYRAMTHMWVKKPRLLQSFPHPPYRQDGEQGLEGEGSFINTHINLLLYL